MEKYNIKIFPTAQNDLREIVEYINTLSPQTAIEYYDLIVEEIGSLSKMPKRCPLAKDTQLRLNIVFYIIMGKVVEIRRIIYAKRQYKWML